MKENYSHETLFFNWYIYKLADIIFTYTEGNMLSLTIRIIQLL